MGDPMAPRALCGGKLQPLSQEEEHGETRMGCYHFLGFLTAMPHPRAHRVPSLSWSRAAERRILETKALPGPACLLSSLELGGHKASSPACTLQKAREGESFHSF